MECTGCQKVKLQTIAQSKSVMSLVNWRNRYDLMPAFPNWVDRFFKDDNFMNKDWPGELAVPAVNVKETDKTFELEVAAPGMVRDDFKLEVKDGSLIISAESKTEKEEKDDNYTRREFNFSSFRRSFWLPENVMADKIEAKYKDGMLLVELPKIEVEKVKKPKLIKVK